MLLLKWGLETAWKFTREDEFMGTSVAKKKEKEMRKKNKALENIKKDLTEVEIEFLKLENPPRGFKTQKHQEIADKYDISFKVVSNFYYRHIKGIVTLSSEEEVVDTEINTEEDKLENYRDAYEETTKALSTPYDKEKSMDERINDHASKSLNQLKTPELKPNKLTYSYGEMVPVKVIHILPYGVLLQSMDGYMFEGLLHKKEIKNGWVTDVKDHFQIGDEFEARVIRGVKENELAFSTKGMKLKEIIKRESEQPKWFEEEYDQPENPPLNTMGDKLSAVKDQIKLSEKPVSIPEPKPPKEVIEVHTPPEQKASDDNPQVKEVVDYLNSIVGMVSPSAKEDIENVLSKHGPIKFTIAMMEVAKNFDVDLGKLFMEKVEQKLSGGL